ncbi:MAG: hypothetical protein QOH57_5368 [Mycobacterium sp.]|nr:hypothetical protein [Mycobacterium sp.]
MIRDRVCAGIAAGLLVAGAMLSPAAASAQPVSNSTLEKECKKAGGTWESVPDGHGGTESSCAYRDNDGNKFRDFYKNGKYVGTDDVGR